MKLGLLMLMLVVSSWVHAATYYTSNAATSTYNFNSISNWKSNTDGSGSSPGAINSADDYVVQFVPTLLFPYKLHLIIEDKFRFKM
jgi:hypothetical protein